MRVGARIDQLRVDSHLVPRPLHTTLEQMRHAQLLPDLAQVARRVALVIHHRGAADHFQVGEFGQSGQDLILHAVGEEGVVFIAAEIVEGQHGDALLRHSGRSARRRRALSKIEEPQPRSPRRQGEAR